MKGIVILAVLLTLLAYKISAQKVIKAKNAYRFIGKEVTVKDRYRLSFNSSYVQAACFKLGPDSAHVQLTVYIQGELYSQGRYGVTDTNGTIQFTGIIYKGKDGLLYMNTTR